MGDLARPVSQLEQYIAEFSLSLVVRSIGNRRFMELARHAAKINADVQRVINEWDGLGPFLQRQVDWNDLCRVKAVDAKNFLLVVAEAEMRFCNSASVLIATFNLPLVFAASAKRALATKGVKDRRMLLEAAGFLPAPKGMEVKILKQIAAQVAHMNAGGKALPRFEDTMLQLEAMREHKERGETTHKQSEGSPRELFGGYE